MSAYSFCMSCLMAFGLFVPEIVIHNPIWAYLDYQFRDLHEHSKVQ